MENLHDRTLKKLVSDRGGEFLNHKFKTLSEKCGFQHVFSPAETTQHNGFAERANQILDKKVVTTRHATFNENLFPKVSGDIGELIVDLNSNHWPATVVDETHIAVSAMVDELQADEQLEDTSRVVDEVHVPHEEASNADEPSLNLVISQVLDLESR
ncbi:hypothetical protein O181_069303 [Austropuccinia psidii MF-1]|uniref:Integrase catalytic domain-containing protein n=1 Tax=Austropuccinia psidii MF-1 TaxID=1389203 RepID=A0A9Q3F1Z9_9BASI|nr:hypothetical protein [Austropuccinia psidii MF-1]